jgi:hypothetical protein
MATLGDSVLELCVDTKHVQPTEECPSLRVFPMGERGCAFSYFSRIILHV